jgi:PAS domain S-box-containing protein
MGQFKNSIATKLAGGFGLCVLLLVSLVGFNIIHLQRLDKLYSETLLRSKHMNLAADTRQIDDNLEAIISHAVINRNMVKSGHDWAVAREESLQKLQRLATTVDTLKERQAFDAAIEAFGDIVRIFEQEMQPLLEKGTKVSDSMLVAIDARLDQRIESLERSLQQMAQIETDENEGAAQEFHAELRDAEEFSLVISLLGVLAALSVALLSSRRIIRPLGEITHAALEMEKGNYHFMLAHRSKDETGVLANAFRRMAEEVGKRTVELEEANLRLNHEIDERILAEEEVRILNTGLEHRVAERTAELVGTVDALEMEVAERIAAEQALRVSEERYSLVIKGANEGIWDWDVLSGSTYLSPRLKNILGYADDELPNDRDVWLSRLHPDDYPKVMAALNRYLSGESPKYELEYRVMHRDGGERWVLSRGSSLHDETGRIKRIAGSVMDITDRKRVEGALKKSETTLRIVLEMLPVGVWVADAEGRIVMINRAGKQIWCGKNFDNIEMAGVIRGWRPDTGEELTGEDWPLARAVCRHETTLNEIIDIECLAGERKTISNSAVPVTNSADTLIAAVAVSEDITEKRLAEEQLKSSHEQLRMLYVHLDTVREDERANLAREIHDELGQQLTVLKFDASWLNVKLPATEQALIEKTESMKELIDTTINTVRRIATDLRPRLLDELGLPAAIEWYVGQFRERTDIGCRLDLELRKGDVDQRRAITLFRVFQEALTNAMRHSGATEVTVSLRRKADRIVLEVVDNGMGISRKALSASGSFGLNGMRERVAQCGGRLTITGECGKGTKVRVSLPFTVKEE